MGKERRILHSYLGLNTSYNQDRTSLQGIMYSQWICFASILGTVIALPMHSNMEAEKLMTLFQDENVGRNSAIENLIIEALEDLRETMLTGTDDIPILDPLHVEHISVDDTVIPIPGARLEIRDLMVRDLSTFELVEVSVQQTSPILPRYNLRLWANIPLVDVNIGYHDFLIHFWGLDLFGTGDGKISITKPWLLIDANVNLRLGLLAVYLNIQDLKLDFGLDDIYVGITGMFNDPTVDDFVNRFLRNLILELAEFWTEDISDIISPILVDEINAILSDLNLIDIITP